jgi:hypothetical protein
LEVEQVKLDQIKIKEHVLNEEIEAYENLIDTEEVYHDKVSANSDDEDKYHHDDE